jgi:hypothetical protein
MATALRDVPILRSFALDADLQHNDRFEMNEDWPYALPDRYIVRTIDIQIVGGRLLASFRNTMPPQQVPVGEDIGDVIDALLGQQPANALPIRGSAPGTPIDLVLTGDPVFVIYILGDPDNAKFNPELKAMTHKNKQDFDNYGRLRHVNAAGEFAKPADDCQLIYFVASPPRPEETPYRHRFNLNVRFAQDPTPSGEDQVLDVEIDPDIRYPGQ